MRRATALLSAVAIVLSAAGTFAQKANFAGTWVREAPAGGAPGGGGGGGGRGGGGGGFGMNPTITQSATELVVSYTQGENPVKLTFKLDGTESKNSMMGRGGAPTEQVSKATWTGDKLTIVTTTPNGEQKRVLGLEGGNLVVEQTTPGREGGAPTTAKIVYKKG